MSQNDTLVTDASAVLANPAAHGFEWYSDAISKGGKVLTTDAPRVRVVDLDVFVKSFGTALVLSCVNGTSLDVKVESVVRGMYEKNVTAKTDDVRAAVVRRVLMGARERSAPTVRTVTVEKIVFVAMDGTKFDTEIEKQQHDLAALVESGMNITAAKALLKL